MSDACEGHHAGAGAVILATSGAKPTEHTGSATATFKSKYRGLSWDKKYEGWRVRIYFAGKQRHVGRYADEFSAVKAYDKAAVYLYGRSAITNFGLEACKADCTTEVSDFIITAKTLVQEQPAAADQRPRYRTNSNNWQHQQQQPQHQADGGMNIPPCWPYPAAVASTPSHLNGHLLQAGFAGTAGHALHPQQQQQMLMQQVGECAGPMPHAQQFPMQMQAGILQQGYSPPPAQPQLMPLMQPGPEGVRSVQDHWAAAAAAAAAAGVPPQQQQMLLPDGAMLAVGSPAATQASMPGGSTMLAAAAAAARPASVMAQPDASLLAYGSNSSGMGACCADLTMGHHLLPAQQQQQQQLWAVDLNRTLPAVCGPLLHVPQHSTTHHSMHAAAVGGTGVSTGGVGLAGMGWQGQWMEGFQGQVPGWN